MPAKLIDSTITDVSSDTQQAIHGYSIEAELSTNKVMSLCMDLQCTNLSTKLKFSSASQSLQTHTPLRFPALQTQAASLQKSVESAVLLRMGLFLADRMEIWMQTKTCQH